MMTQTTKAIDLSGKLGLNSLKSQRNHLIQSVNLLTTLLIKSLILDNTEAHRTNKKMIQAELGCSITVADPSWNEAE